MQHSNTDSCILLKFYIKPQPGCPSSSVRRSLYLIEILHQTTTCGKCEDCLRRCILLKFYIKPQLRSITSSSVSSCILLKFYIKPQPSIRRLYLSRLYLIEILHQTTTTLVANGDFSSCILLKFYIKPQHETCSRNAVAVVSY